MTSKQPADPLDLECGHPVTPEDIAAQRRLRQDAPSWFSVDWRALLAMVPAEALDRRAVARDSWTPFSLE